MRDREILPVLATEIAIEAVDKIIPNFLDFVAEGISNDEVEEIRQKWISIVVRAFMDRAEEIRPR